MTRLAAFVAWILTALAALAGCQVNAVPTHQLRWEPVDETTTTTTVKVTSSDNATSQPVAIEESTS